MIERIDAFRTNQWDDGMDPYKVFDPQTYNYLWTKPGKFDDLGNGTYKAGPYTNTYNVRGNKDGVPVIFLPGGPGSSLSSGYKKYFDAAKYRVAFSDWRGVGTSRPVGIVESNTTQDLISDIEQIRTCSGSEQVILCGASWGLTMALLYAQHNPEKVLGIAGRSPLLASRKDIEWCYSAKGAATFLPNSYEAFYDFGRKDNPYELLQTYMDAINSPDESLQCEAYQRFTNWDLSCKFGEETVCEDIRWGTDSSRTGVERMKVVLHYAVNDYFLSDAGCLPMPEKLANIPIIIAQNEADPSVNPDTRDLFQKFLPNAEYLVQTGVKRHGASSLGASDPFTDGGCAYGLEKMRRSLVMA
jgi:proline iminopeptidase